MNTSKHDLASKHCRACEGGVPALSCESVKELLSQLDGWEQKDQTIYKTYSFKNYYQTMAFVNAVAWISHNEDHHPDIVVGYNQCGVTYTTHAIKGLSENDFICAVKLDKLFEI